MKEYKGLTFAKLQEADIVLLTPIMRDSFNEDTRIHLEKESGGPTGYDDGSFLRKYALNPKATAYTIRQGEQVIGAVILWINRDNHQNFLGNIFVHVGLENRGIGTTIWQFIEQEYPDTLVWRTETPTFSRRNHHFYVNKCGFHIVAIKNPKDWEEGSYLLEKVMK